MRVVDATPEGKLLVEMTRRELADIASCEPDELRIGDEITTYFGWDEDAGTPPGLDDEIPWDRFQVKPQT